MYLILTSVDHGAKLFEEAAFLEIPHTPTDKRKGRVSDICKKYAHLHTFFISNAFFQFSLSVAEDFHELNLKCCIGVA